MGTVRKLGGGILKSVSVDGTVPKYHLALYTARRRCARGMSLFICVGDDREKT